jgi:hypothetical protein
MDNYKIAILITTFLRDNLLYKTLQTIVDNYPADSVVLIADQGYANSEKDITIDYYKSQIPLEYYKIPFDSGLSYARNYLVQKASEMHIPYCLLMADSIQFLASYNFNPIIQFLELDGNRGLVGFDLEDSKCKWEYLMEITSKGIQFSYSDKDTFFGNIKFTQVDICRNVFLAKTKTLLNLWDEELKLAEHEVAFLEYKKRGCEVYWTDAYVFKRISGRNNEEYETYRKRFGDYKKLMQQKLGINGWIIYPPKYRK